MAPVFTSQSFPLSHFFWRPLAQFRYHKLIICLSPSTSILDSRFPLIISTSILTHVMSTTRVNPSNPTFEGMTIMDQLSKMRQELDTLLPVQKQVLSIRVPVLQKATE